MSVSHSFSTLCIAGGVKIGSTAAVSSVAAPSIDEQTGAAQRRLIPKPTFAASGASNRHLMGVLGRILEQLV